MKKQIMLIHGGDVWETHEAYLNYLKSREIDFEKHGLGKEYWEDRLQDKLGSGYEIIRPEMPDKRNAKYEEWRIWFEKFIPYLHDEVVLVGGSLGGTFLAKYLAENNLGKKIKAVFLLAACFEDLPDEKLLSFSLPASLSKIENQAEKIYLYHSKDDNVVPFAHLAKFQAALPKARARIFENRGHFNVVDLPEIAEDIKDL